MRRPGPGCEQLVPVVAPAASATGRCRSTYALSALGRVRGALYPCPGRVRGAQVAFEVPGWRLQPRPFEVTRACSRSPAPVRDNGTVRDTREPRRSPDTARCGGLALARSRTCRRSRRAPRAGRGRRAKAQSVCSGQLWGPRPAGAAPAAPCAARRGPRGKCAFPTLTTLGAQRVGKPLSRWEAEFPSELRAPRARGEGRRYLREGQGVPELPTGNAGKREAEGERGPPAPALATLNRRARHAPRARPSFRKRAAPPRRDRPLRWSLRARAAAIIATSLETTLGKRPWHKTVLS